MKNFLKITSLALILLASACKHDLSEGKMDILRGDNCSYSIDYDAEVTMTTKPINSADMSRLTPQDRVDLMPETSRNAVSFCMKKNGSSEWLIEKKQPQEVFEPINKMLPDPSPKTKIIRIRDDLATFIDEQGKVIRETKFEVNQLSIGLKEMVKIANTTNPTHDFEKMLTDVRKDGGTISDMGNGVYNLTKKITSPTETVTVMVTVDKTVGRLVGNAIYDNMGEPKFVVIYNYERGTTTPILKNVIQRGYNTTKSGVAMVSQKIIQFHKLEISGTLNDEGTDNSKLY
jgi:hypothetical protein